MQIYVQHGGQQLGPFTEAELKAQLESGAISAQDHVWWQGQANWIPLSQSQFAPGGAAMPSIPAMPGAPSPLPSMPGSPGTPPKSNLALWALVCGCLSLVCSLFASIPAIILGHISLSRIKKNPGMEGHGMALAGLILGYVFTIALPFISIVAISVLIALGNQVKDVFSTINSQLAIEGMTNSSDQSSSDQSTNSSDSSSTNSDQSTNSSDESTNAAPATSSPDQSTNSAPAAPASPDSSTNSPDSSPASTTNSPPMNQ